MEERCLWGQFRVETQIQSGWYSGSLSKAFWSLVRNLFQLTLGFRAGGSGGFDLGARKRGFEGVGMTFWAD